MRSPHPHRIVLEAHMADESNAIEGSPWFKRLYDLFAPTRDAVAASDLTDDQINAEIDRAIREVRAKRRATR